MSLIGWSLCLCGKHKYQDKIKITGPRKSDGSIPVCVYQKCERCYKIGNEVHCNVFTKENNEEEKGSSE